MSLRTRGIYSHGVERGASRQPYVEARRVKEGSHGELKRGVTYGLTRMGIGGGGGVVDGGGIYGQSPIVQQQSTRIR